MAKIRTGLFARDAKTVTTKSGKTFDIPKHYGCTVKPEDVQGIDLSNGFYVELYKNEKRKSENSPLFNIQLTPVAPGAAAPAPAAKAEGLDDW